MLQLYGLHSSSTTWSPRHHLDLQLHELLKYRGIHQILNACSLLTLFQILHPPAWMHKFFVLQNLIASMTEQCATPTA